MNTPESQDIIRRFFGCIDMLHKTGELRFKKDFTRRFEIRYSTFQQSEMDPASDRFQVAWITYLALGYGISPEYILTGKADSRIRELKRKFKRAADRKEKAEAL